MKTNSNSTRTATNDDRAQRYIELCPDSQSLDGRLLSSPERIFERRAREGLRYWIRIFGYNEIVPPENDLDDGGRFLLTKQVFSDM